MFLAHIDETLDDEDYTHFVKSLTYRSGVIVKVSRLESGYSRDVDGEIAVINGLRNWNLTSAAVENKAFHFKLTDNAIKLFAKGLSAGFV